MKFIRAYNLLKNKPAQRFATRADGSNQMMITRAKPSDEDEIKDMLRSCLLPSEDLSSGLMDGFLVLRQAGALIGTVGLEKFGQVGLLRSLAVRGDSRGKSWGLQLTRQIEELARQHGLRELFLLTTTAEDFFTRQGYHIISREQAPASIQDTAEFKSLCPSSAVFMHKTLS